MAVLAKEITKIIQIQTQPLLLGEHKHCTGNPGPGYIRDKSQSVLIKTCDGAVGTFKRSFSSSSPPAPLKHTEVQPLGSV